jgi:hypothetical protein
MSGQIRQTMCSSATRDEITPCSFVGVGDSGQLNTLSPVIFSSASLSLSAIQSAA